MPAFACVAPRTAFSPSSHASSIASRFSGRRQTLRSPRGALRVAGPAVVRESSVQHGNRLNVRVSVWSQTTGYSHGNGTPASSANTGGPQDAEAVCGEAALLKVFFSCCSPSDISSWNNSFAKKDQPEKKKKSGVGNLYPGPLRQRFKRCSRCGVFPRVPGIPVV